MSKDTTQAAKETTTGSSGKTDEIHFDFSKITGFFKKKDQPRPEHKPSLPSVEEVSFDGKAAMASLGQFFKKYGMVLLILIPLFLAVFFRLYPLYLPQTDDWAQNTVYNNVQNSIEQQVNQKYPNLPDTNKQAIIDEQFQQTLIDNKDALDDQITQYSTYFKSRMQDDQGNAYLPDIDPYLWYGYIRTSLETGFFGDSVVDGKNWYSLRNGRFGKVAEEVFVVHLYIGKWLYQSLHVFNKDIALSTAFLLIMPLVMALSTIPAFFIGRKIGGNFAGFVAALVIAINPAVISRTITGDTDAYNILFPLFIAWMFVEAIETDSFRNRIIFSSLGGFLVGLYTRAWSGWWYVMDFILAALAISLAYYIVQIALKKEWNMLAKNPSIRKIFVIGSSFLVSSVIFVTLFRNFKTFTAGLLGPLTFTQLKDVAVKSVWPNVLTTVAEFNAIPLSDIVNQMGGIVLFSLGIVGILLTILVKKDGKRDVLYAAFLTVWFIGTAYSFTKGVRFSILMVPAFAIALGIAMGLIYKHASAWISREMHMPSFGSRAIIALILLMFFLFPVNIVAGAHNTAKSTVPMADDAWYESLTAIKNDDTDGIITSWWDFGHWFVTIAQRRVTFDGADQERKIVYVGKSLLTSSEEESVGILRMLNCGQNKAPVLLSEYMNNDTAEAISTINHILVQDKSAAQKTLESKGLDATETAAILNLTHCDNLLPQYYITSEDMVGKSGVWAHFGGWDFDKATMFNVAKNKPYPEATAFLMSRYNMTQEQADATYYEVIGLDSADSWVSPWPSYQGTAQCERSGDLVQCANSNIGIQINLTSHDALIPTNQGTKHPESVLYATTTGLAERKFNDSTLAISVALVPDGKGYYAVFSDPRLVDSMFTRLFFYEGHGTRHFELLSDKTTLTGSRILVWKVNWDTQDPLVMDELKNPGAVAAGDTVSVNYIGSTGGEIFDSSIINWKAKGITPSSSFSGQETNLFTFTVGAGQVIPGFDAAVVGMKTGETKTVTLAPEEAYGTDPTAHPLGGKTLTFTIQVVSVS